MTVEEQLRLWVEGTPVHDKERNQCCPDFSCCTGKMVSKDVREKFEKAFKDGDESQCEKMLFEFLSMLSEEHSSMTKNSINHLNKLLNFTVH